MSRWLPTGTHVSAYPVRTIARAEQILSIRPSILTPTHEKREMSCRYAWKGARDASLYRTDAAHVHARDSSLHWPCVDSVAVLNEPLGVFRAGEAFGMRVSGYSRTSRLVLGPVRGRCPSASPAIAVPLRDGCSPPVMCRSRVDAHREAGLTALRVESLLEVRISSSTIGAPASTKKLPSSARCVAEASGGDFHRRIHCAPVISPQLSTARRPTATTGKTSM